jgi:hypothetical protein
MASSSAASSSKSSADKPKIDPILRNAIRYSVSAHEYRALHSYLSKKRATGPFAQRALEPGRYDAAVAGKDDFNAAAVRSALRTFVASQAGLKMYDLILDVLLRRGANKYAAMADQRFWLLTFD